MDDAISINSNEIAVGSPSGYLRRRRYIYELLHTPEVETELERWVRIGIAILIIVSMISVALETEPSIESRLGGLFQILEYVTIAAFSLEYVLRLWSAVEDPRYRHPIIGRARYMLSAMAVIDLLAIAPFFFPRYTEVDLRFLRGLRLLALARIAHFGEYSRSIARITKVLREKKHEMAMSMFIVSVLLFVSGTVMYNIEHAAQPKVFTSIPAALWWGVATLTTIGYGDMYPITPLGKLCAAIVAVLGISIFALPSGIFASAFMQELQREETKG